MCPRERRQYRGVWKRRTNSNRRYEAGKKKDLARFSVIASLGRADLPYTPNTLYGEIVLSVWWHIPAIPGVPRL